MKKVLVTGSSGMLGGDLCLKLAGDYKVIGFDIKQALSPVEENFEFLKVDLTNKTKLQKKIEIVRPDFIIHAAAYTDVDGCELNPEKAYLCNSDVTKSIAQICKDRGVGLVFISTDFVFDGRKNAAYKETDRPNPLSVYGKSKLKAEQNIREICNNFYIFRSAWLFGKWGKNFVRTIIEKAKDGQNLRVVNDQRGCPTYTRDLSFALYKFVHIVLESGDCESGVFHVVNSGSCSWYEFAKAILREIKAEIKIEPISSGQLTRPAPRPAWSVLDCNKFEGLMDLKLRPWREALSDYINRNF